MKRHLLLALVMVVALAGFTGRALSENFPTKPVTYIIGWSTGGGSDLVSRVLCAEAERHLGQPIVIVNKPGGSGAKAYMEISQAKPDGYVIGNCTGTISTHKFMGNIPIGSEAFEIIITFNSDPGGIWVKKDAPWKTLKDFVAYAKENPEKVTVAASNPGSITRFGLIFLEENAGVKFRIASQAGGEGKGPQLVAGGHVDACQAAPVTGRPLFESGLIRPLGFMSEERVSAFPEIPTYKEQGFDITVANYRQVLAPKGTPPEVVNALYAAFKKAVASEKFQTFMKQSASVPLDWGPEKSRQFLADQDASFKQMITRMGLYKEKK
jgi:tripartite-type tricarboxylate transporter receptor subunit TctC